MKAKVIVLAAIFCSAAISTSNAQVYSVNVVGYATVTLPARGFGILGVPLNGPTNNSLNSILPLPAGYDGCNIYRFNCSSQSYLDTVSWIEGFGWLSPSDPDPVINPGEGFFLQNGANTPLSFKWIGDVATGTLNNPIPGNNRYCMKASVLPIAGRLEEIGFPPCDGDNVYVFDPGCQCYLDTYTYLAGLGWISGSDPDPRGPYINVGQGFFIQRTCPTGNWVQTFSVGQ